MHLAAIALLALYIEHSTADSRVLSYNYNPMEHDDQVQAMKAATYF